MPNESAHARSTFAAGLRAAIAVFSVLGVAGTVTGQTIPLDAFQVGYAANLPFGDSFIDLTNAGAVNGFDPVGDICANIYVFDSDQQMIACCTCPLTPNHLKGVSVRNDLISNTLTPGVPTEVSVVVTASLNNPCNPAQVVNFAPGLRAWGITIHQTPGGGYTDTETRFLTASPSASELSKLTSYCGFIQANGSGFGICNSCVPSGPPGGGGGPPTPPQ